MKKRFVKAMGMMLAVAMIITGVGFMDVVTVKAEKVYNADGYDENGYDRNGYDVDGYDADGYDKDGYDREGYDKNGYDRNENLNPKFVKKPDRYDVYKIISTNYKDYKGWYASVKKDNVISVTTTTKTPKVIINRINKWIDNLKNVDFTADIKTKNVKKGYGEYILSLRYGEMYNNAVVEYSVYIFPLAHMGIGESMSHLYTIKDTLKYMDGFEYKVLRGKQKIKKYYDKNGKMNGYSITAVTNSKYKVIKKGSKKIKDLKVLNSNDERCKYAFKYVAPGMGKNKVMAEIGNLNPNIDFSKKPKNMEESLKRSLKTISGDVYVRFYFVKDGKKVYSPWMQ